MKKTHAAAPKPVFAFRMPTSENLLPIRLDLESDSNRRLKDTFTWNVHEPDSEIAPFARRMVQEQKLPIVFLQQIIQAMQSQIGEFRSLEAQQLSTEEKVLTVKLDLRINNIVIRDQFLWDVGDFDSDPEGFARGLCKDLDIDDPAVGPAIAFAIREQLYEIAKQNVTSSRETRITKKARRDRGIELSNASSGTTALNLMRRPNNKISIIRKKAEWEAFEPSFDVLTEEEVENLDAKDERNAKLKRRLDDKDDFAARYVRS